MALITIHEQPLPLPRGCVKMRHVYERGRSLLKVKKIQWGIKRDIFNFLMTYHDIFITSKTLLIEHCFIIYAFCVAQEILQASHVKYYYTQL